MRQKDDSSIILGGDWQLETLLTAYRQGYFPWPDSSLGPILWSHPPVRGILYLKDFHLSRDQKKDIKKSDFLITKNKCFAEVIKHCQQSPRKNQNGTWITRPLEQAYLQLHKLGYAISFEVWQKQKLCGGLYGIYVDGVFSGESMFHLVPEASRAALQALVNTLQNSGHKWIDIQQLTPHMKRMGAKTIFRRDYEPLLARSQVADQNWTWVEAHSI